MPRARRTKGRRLYNSKGGYTVFISHSSRDNWIAGVIKEKIEALGIQVWLDEKDLEGGDVLAGKIIDGIDACNEAIVLVSPHSAASQWVAFEIGAVRAQRKRVTPILYAVDRTVIDPARDIKSIDLNSFPEFLGQIGKRAKAS